MNNILLQVVKVVPHKTIQFEKDTLFEDCKNKKNVIDFVLDAEWMNTEKIIPSMASLKVASP